MKKKELPEKAPFYCRLLTIFLVLFLSLLESGTSQVLKITEALSWMNKAKAQVLRNIASEQFVYQGKEAGFLKYGKRYSMGICHLQIAFKNDQLDVIGWNEFVGYAGQLMGEVTLNGFQETGGFDIVKGFKNYDRRLILTLIDHSATANEIMVTIGRMTDSDLKKRYESNQEATKKVKIEDKDPANGGPISFSKVDQEAEFTGGSSAFLQYLNNNLKYPDTALHNGVEGTVLIQFIIEKDGSIADVKVLEGEDLGYGLADEAVKVISNMPKWIPARQGDRNVRSYKKQPITFRLPPKSTKSSSTYDKPKAIFKRVHGTGLVWFTGTKKFCDGLGAWYYKVTIIKNEITLKRYADKKNQYYKNMVTPVETIQGFIQEAKIVTKDTPEYKTNRFKFEEGILYEVNNEGGYNAYQECQD